MVQRFSDWLVESVNDEYDTYEDYFNALLRKYDVDSPDELSTGEKKKFYEELDKWESDEEDD